MLPGDDPDTQVQGLVTPGPMTAPGFLGKAYNFLVDDVNKGHSYIKNITYPPYQIDGKTGFNIDKKCFHIIIVYESCDKCDKQGYNDMIKNENGKVVK